MILKKCFIIAEAGVNHNGDILLAKELILKAKQTGVDAVKFQSFKADRVISKFANKANYQKNNTTDNESQLAMLQKLELTDDEFIELSSFSKKNDIMFLSTPKDIESAKFLESINMQLYKIGSSEVNNYEFLEFIGKTNKPIILSTGMCTLDEVSAAIEVVKNTGNKSISLLHCVSQYPCPIDQANLLAIKTMKKAFNLKVGYSDHTMGSDAILASISMGAEIIEKHFTIDNTLPGPNHKVSMNYKEMKKMVISIRNIESALGDGIKKPAKCEKENVYLLRRSLVFSENLNKGTKIDISHLTIKRPGNGLEPKYKNDLLGKELIKDVIVDEPVTWNLFNE
jgi:N-acetylneuraminate synthase